MLRSRPLKPYALLCLTVDLAGPREGGAGLSADRFRLELSIVSSGAQPEECSSLRRLGSTVADIVAFLIPECD